MKWLREVGSRLNKLEQTKANNFNCKKFNLRRKTKMTCNNKDNQEKKKESKKRKKKKNQKLMWWNHCLKNQSAWKFKILSKLYKEWQNKFKKKQFSWFNWYLHYIGPVMLLKNEINNCYLEHHHKLRITKIKKRNGNIFIILFKKK